MEPAMKNISYININMLNPNLWNGGIIVIMDVLLYLKSKGHYTESISFLCNDIYKYYIPSNTSNTNFLIDENKKILCYRMTLKYIDFYQEILPINSYELSERFQPALKRIFSIIYKKKIDYIITSDDDFISIFGAFLSGVPVVHWFNSLQNIVNCKENNSFLRFLKQSHIFTISSFLQYKLKEILNLDSVIWYPMFNIKKYKVKREKKSSKIIGYYSAGKLKGDDIVNRIIHKKDDWKFIIIGRDYLSKSNKVSSNLQILGNITNIEIFYKAIDILIVPSIIEEGFSRVIIEACVNGITVIANKVGGIPEAMGNSGIMIDVNLEKELNFEAIADQYIFEIEKLFSDDKYYEIMSKKALFRAEEYEDMQNRLSEENYNKYIKPFLSSS